MPKAPKKPRKGVKPKPRPAPASKAKAKRKPASKGRATAKAATKAKGATATKTATKTDIPTKTRALRPKREPIAPSLSKGPQVRPTTTTTTTKAVTKDVPRARAKEEQLGELPERYEDDSLVVLPVDPSTLFVWWDLAAGSVRQAAEGLSSPKARLAIVEGKTVVREVDLALESRSFYVHGLPPGHSYHAEILWLDARGQRRRIGHPSASIGLPIQGPSRRVDDRFVMFRFDGKLGPGVDPARLPPGPGGEIPGGTSGWGSSEHSGRAGPNGGKPGSESP